MKLEFSHTVTLRKWYWNSSMFVTDKWEFVFQPDEFELLCIHRRCVCLYLLSGVMWLWTLWLWSDLWLVESSVNIELVFVGCNILQLKWKVNALEIWTFFGTIFFNKERESHIPLPPKQSFVLVSLLSFSLIPIFIPQVMAKNQEQNQFFSQGPTWSSPPGIYSRWGKPCK